MDQSQGARPESYLRFMYLKHRHGIGYETLVKEVSDSLSWRRFCRVRLDGRDPLSGSHGSHRGQPHFGPEQDRRAGESRRSSPNPSPGSPCATQRPPARRNLPGALRLGADGLPAAAQSPGRGATTGTQNGLFSAAFLDERAVRGPDVAIHEQRGVVGLGPGRSGAELVPFSSLAGRHAPR